MTLRARLLAIYTTLAVVGVIAVSLFSSWQIKSYLDRRAESDLRAQVGAIAALVRGGEIPADSLPAHEQTIRRIARALNLRLTFVRRDGAVVFDSELPLDSLVQVENHLHRPELEGSRSGGVGMNRRESATVHEEFLYAATMVTDAPGNARDTVYVRVARPFTDIQALDRQVQLIIWIIGALSILVIAVVSARASRGITRPILEIATAARAIREGDLARRIPVTTGDEIGTLAAAINDMAETLGNDITQLRKLERVRSEFLGNVSHELRTPIFSLQGFLETLLDGAVDDPSVNREFLEKAHRHASRLNTLLNDLIEISRIESGEMKMSFRFLPLSALLDDVKEEMSPSAARKNLSLTVDAGACAADQVYGDKERLKQVMINLLDNAIKYTDPGGQISVGARRDGATTLAVEVTDTGSGIPAQHLSRIFERFYRVDKDRSREVGGTGLGLAIVKHIVEAHGGTIRVESTVGKGSTFIVTLRRST
ncbi:MAG TPA: ATP-binding protein [Bacteroidota bacterium]|nr:ATP-binding protein [Bacteroidota bacterium]